MEALLTLANKIIISVSILTALGVFIHDVRVDYVVIAALSHPRVVASSQDETAQLTRGFMEADTHTHPDRNAAKGALMSSFTYQSPSVPPRRETHHKHVLRQIELGGRHLFDNANLPVVG